MEERTFFELDPHTTHTGAIPQMEDAAPVSDEASVFEPHLNLVSDDVDADNEPTQVEATVTEKSRRERLTRIARTVGPWVVLPLAVAAYTFEQTPLNETFRAHELFHVAEATRSAWKSAGALALITCGIEMASAGLISIGLNLKKQPEWFRNWVSKTGKNEAMPDQLVEDKALTEPLPETAETNDAPDNNTDEKEHLYKRVGKRVAKFAGKLAIDSGIALNWGAGLVTLKDHRKDPNRGLLKDIRTSAYATSIVATFSGFVGYVLTGGMENAKRIGLGSEADWLVKHGAQWETWAVIVGVPYAAWELGKRGVKKVRNLRNSNKVKHVEGADINEPTAA